MAKLGVGPHEVTIQRTACGGGGQKAPYIAVLFADSKGDTITGYFFLTGGAWQYTEEKLRTMGWDPAEHGNRFEELNTEPSPIKGNAVEIVNKEETFNGKPAVKVNYVNPPGGRVERMDSSEARAWAEQVRQDLGLRSEGGGLVAADGKFAWETGDEMPKDEDAPPF